MSMLAYQYNQPMQSGDLDLWPLTLKMVSESRVTWATSANFSLLGLSVLELGPTYATERQTDVRQRGVRRQTKASFNAHPLGAGT